MGQRGNGDLALYRKDSIKIGIALALHLAEPFFSLFAAAFLYVCKVGITTPEASLIVL